MRQLQNSLPTSQVEAEIELVLKAFIDIFHPTRVILFGSATTANFYDESDFDFLVVLQSQDEVKRAWKELKKVRPVSKRPLDVIFRSEDDFKLGFAGGASLMAQESGRVLYTRKTISYAYLAEI